MGGVVFNEIAATGLCLSKPFTRYYTW